MTTTAPDPEPHASDDGLVRVAEGLPRQPGGQLAVRVVLGVFLVSLAGTGIVDALFPAPRPRLAGAEAHEDIQRRRTARLADGSLAQLVEYDMRLTSRVRAALMPRYALLLYRLFHEVRGDALVGRDSWLFLEVRALPPERPTGLTVDIGASALAGLDRLLHRLGTRLVVVPVPRKAVVCADWLPEWVDPRPDIDAAFVTALRRRGVEAVDLVTPFAQVDPQLLFDPHGSHWTQEGQLLAAREICRQAGLDVPAEQRTTTLSRRGERRPEIDLLSYVGLDSPAALEHFAQRAGPACIVSGAEGQRPLHVQPRTMPRIAMTGTSFTAHRPILTYLEHFTAAPVWNAAQEGLDPLGLLAELLAERSPPQLPEVLLCEVPVHALFVPQPFEELGQIVAEAEARSGGHVMTVVPADRVRLAQPRTRQQIGTRRLVAEVGGGLLAHDGDGVAWVRLTGEVTQGAVRIDAQSGGPTTYAIWRAGVPQITLPLLSPAPFSGQHALFARAAGKGWLELQGVEVVAPLDPGTAIACTIGPVESAAPGPAELPGPADAGTPHRAGWAQSIALPDGAVVGPQSALLVELAPSRALDEGLRIEVRGEQPWLPPLLLEMPFVRPAARILLGLDRFADRGLTSVTVSGGGPVPETVVARAALLGPPPPLR